jgi:hypothetical protein
MNVIEGKKNKVVAQKTFLSLKKSNNNCIVPELGVFTVSKNSGGR